MNYNSEEDFYSNNNVFYINDYSLAIEAYKLNVKNSRDCLNDEKVKQRLVKLSELADKNGWKNVSSNTNFSKYNKGNAKYDMLSKKDVLFTDPSTKISMFRSVSVRNLVSNYYKKIKNPIRSKKNEKHYFIKAVFEDTKNNKIIFKTVCEIFLSK